MLTTLVESGRRGSNPHDQLGRLVTHPGRMLQFAAMTRTYNIPAPLCGTFGYLGRKSPSPGICEGWCSPVRFYASGDQVAGIYFRPGGGRGPADVSAQGAVGVRTRYYDRPGQRATGPRVIFRLTQDDGLFPGQGSMACRLRRAAEAHRGDPQAELYSHRPGKTPCRSSRTD